MSSRKSGRSRKNNPVTLKICYRLIKFLCPKSLFVHRTYILFIFSISSNRLYSLSWLVYLIPIIVTISLPLQFLFSQLFIVVVVVVVQLLHICKFFFEVVSSLIIKYTELYYFKRSSITHKVFLASSTSISAHLALGNPKIPELIAGIEILLKFLLKQVSSFTAN